MNVSPVVGDESVASALAIMITAASSITRADAKSTILVFLRFVHITSVLVGRVMCSCPARLVVILQHLECIILDLPQLLLLFLGHVLPQDTGELQRTHLTGNAYL